MKQYTVWDEIRRMHQQMDAIFERFFANDQFFSKDLLEAPMPSKKEEFMAYRQPVSDVWETDKEIVAEIELPGIDKRNIQLHIDDHTIDIRAETKSKLENKKEGMYRLERNYTGFYRHFSLPSSVDADKANAEYKEGVLRITVPKLKIGEQKKKLVEVK